MPESPWPFRIGDLLFWEAVEPDLEALLSFRNDPGVNHFMVRTSVDPEELRRDWLAVPDSPSATDGLIGYIVDPRFAGRGIGTVAALLRAAFDGLGLRRVTAAAYADNPASVRILEGAGMRRERLSPQALWHAELGWLDEVGYAILAEEWVDQRRRGSISRSA